MASSSAVPYKFPVWAQIGIGLIVVSLIYVIATRVSPYVSAWDEEDSNFYGNATQALQMSGVHPSAPTAFIFWEKGCEPCKKGIKAFHDVPRKLRIYGIHLSDHDTTEADIRRTWLSLAPPASVTLIDKELLLQTSFKVKAVPAVFIYLPKQKKIYSYLGNIDDNKQRMLDIIASE